MLLTTYYRKTHHGPFRASRFVKWTTWYLGWTKSREVGEFKEAEKVRIDWADLAERDKCQLFLTSPTKTATKRLFVLLSLFRWSNGCGRGERGDMKIFLTSSKFAVFLLLSCGGWLFWRRRCGRVDWPLQSTISWLLWQAAAEKVIKRG